MVEMMERGRQVLASHYKGKEVWYMTLGDAVLTI